MLLALAGALAHERAPGVFFLLYHRTSGDLPVELDLPFALFARQMRHLHATGAVVSYDEALAILRAGRRPPRDLFVLTFDDGFDDLYHRVFPLLRALRLPFTAFVNAGFVEERVPYVLSQPPARPVAPVTWEMLGEMLASGLMTLGAHGYAHRELPRCAPAECERELELPIALFAQRLGARVRHYAYPRAAWDAGVESAVRDRYETAAIAGFRKVGPDGFDPYRITRIPVLKRDGWMLFRAKVRGWLEHERWLYPGERAAVSHAS